VANTDKSDAKKMALRVVYLEPVVSILSFIIILRLFIFMFIRGLPNDLVKDLLKDVSKQTLAARNKEHNIHCTCILRKLHYI